MLYKEVYGSFLAFADAEYFSPARRADPLGRRSLVLEGSGLGVLHFNFLPAFHAISLHCAPPIIFLA